jgi:hypothetical protein
MTDTHDKPAAPAGRSPFVPLALLSLALTAWLAFQTWNLATERSILATAYTNQQPQIDQATKMRAALDTLAATTRRLAGEGSAAAQAVVDELGRRGVTINPGAGGASAPK